jgi:hypothetical protein
MLCTPALQTPWQPVRSLPRHYLSHHTIPSHHLHTTSSHFSTPTLRPPHGTPPVLLHSRHTASAPQHSHYSATTPHLSSVPHAPRASHLHTTSPRFSTHTLRPPHGAPALPLTPLAYRITPRRLRLTPPHSRPRYLRPMAARGGPCLTPRPTVHRHTLRMHGRRRLASHLHISVTCPYITHLHPSHRTPPVLLHPHHTVSRPGIASCLTHLHTTYHMRLARYCACAVRRCAPAPGAAQR